jgi:hypothetical protein
VSCHSATVGQIITSKAGELTVLETWRASKYNQMKTLCRVRCFCGNIFETQLASIKKGSTNSCGCYRSKEAKERFYKHGHVRWEKKLKKSEQTRTYMSWGNSRTVCMNKNHKSYEYYGGRGIEFCDEWQSFENFLNDMGEKPLDYRLNRLDKDGDFEPDNCEWVPIKKKDVS